MDSNWENIVDLQTPEPTEERDEIDDMDAEPSMNGGKDR